MKSRSMYLMIAEDDLDDRLLLKDALEENNFSSSDTQFAGNGEELITLLSTADQLPDLIMLDLNMPKKDGREALKEIRGNREWKHIPIIIFTTSNDEKDIKYSYREGGNTFITKPARFSDLVDTLGTLKTYWFEKAALAS
ncbi:MAG: response regulator [Bacteroidota bacterium]